jgi:hypothetical protein
MVRIEEQLQIEFRIRAGAENMLHVYSAQNSDPVAFREVQLQLDSVNAKIALLQRQFDSYKTMADPRAFSDCEKVEA